MFPAIVNFCIRLGGERISEPIKNKSNRERSAAPATITRTDIIRTHMHCNTGASYNTILKILMRHQNCASKQKAAKSSSDTKHH
ncbi:hypothetical protein GDO78_014343 [Eleutherodactylus coqui]|uniref:Uncharacterized protein n=1 Tax=Eleutherodactylus coqui TaxID=57060 RepID=A0A8J6EP38_ELECQ|nr:hypothetical protein GDO78_014343 [Eleutherodactylus coqui]